MVMLPVIANNSVQSKNSLSYLLLLFMTLDVDDIAKSIMSIIPKCCPLLLLITPTDYLISSVCLTY